MEIAMNIVIAVGVFVLVFVAVVLAGLEWFAEGERFDYDERLPDGSRKWLPLCLDDGPTAWLESPAAIKHREEVG